MVTLVNIERRSILKGLESVCSDGIRPKQLDPNSPPCIEQINMNICTAIKGLEKFSSHFWIPFLRMAAYELVKLDWSLTSSSDSKGKSSGFLTLVSRIFWLAAFGGFPVRRGFGRFRLGFRRASSNTRNISLLFQSD